MKKLVALGNNDTCSYVQSKEYEDIYILYVVGENSCLSFNLVKENNRGWTLRSWVMGSNAIDIFLSRGDWEMVED